MVTDHLLQPRHPDQRRALAGRAKAFAHAPDQTKRGAGLQQPLHAVGRDTRELRQRDGCCRAIHQTMQNPQLDERIKHLRCDKSLHEVEQRLALAPDNAPGQEKAGRPALEAWTRDKAVESGAQSTASGDRSGRTVRRKCHRVRPGP